MTTDAQTVLAQMWLDEHRRTDLRVQEAVEAALANYRPRGLATLVVGLPVPTLGECAFAEVSFPCVLQEATLLADAPGTLEVDVFRAPTLSSFDALSQASISGGAGIALPAGLRVGTVTDMAAWSPVLLPGCVLIVSILACTGVATASLCLTVRRT